MSRGVVLGVLVAIGAATAVSAAYQAQQNQPKVVEVEKLKDNLYMLKGGGGNTAVFIGATGVVVVDTKLPGWGQPIIDKIKELTPKPVTTIINTHTHGDHVSGNVEFPATVDIIVQENTKTNMDKMMNPPGMGNGASAPTIFQQNNVQRQNDAR
jgi:glyoxylase-like metal-dependent hydrolase (beta-lactamase superfamily II)